MRQANPRWLAEVRFGLALAMAPLRDRHSSAEGRRNGLSNSNRFNRKTRVWMLVGARKQADSKQDTGFVLKNAPFLLFL
jgi:hypothetical protein